MLTSLPTDIIVPPDQRSFADEYLSLRRQKFLTQKWRKICVHGLGIPWVGKTTKIHQFIRENSQLKDIQFTQIGNDDIMQAMPDYQAAVNTDWPEQAFKDFELPARAIGYELLREAVASGVNLLIDHSGTAEYRPTLLREIQSKWYYIIMVHVHCELKEALRRSKIREKETKRHVPEWYFPIRQSIIERLKPVYMEIVNEFHTIDNSLPN